MIFYTVTLALLYIFWNRTQKYLSYEHHATDRIFDKMHDSKFISSANEYLAKNVSFAKLNIIITTLLLDINIIYVVYNSITYDQARPIFLLVVGVILRQMCQFVIKLPVPHGMVWFDPQFPTFFMVYNTVNDFFFSGHTLVSIITGMTIYSQTNSILIALYAIMFVIYEIMFVAVSRSHYFMDIYAGVSTYFMLNYFFDNYFAF